MGHIIAIGGGEIGRPGYNLETYEIDKYIVEQTGKTRPILTFLPTATHDSDIYTEAVTRLYGEMLHCEVRAVELTKRRYDSDELADIILTSDIVYVGGGDTRFMLNLWIETGVDVILRKAFDAHIILAGLSAGAICWYGSAASDSILEGEYTRTGFLPCLDFIPMVACPHYQEELRRTRFKELLLRLGSSGVGIDNCAAISIKGDDFTVVCSEENAAVYFVSGDTDRIRETKLIDGQNGSLESLN